MVLEDVKTETAHPISRKFDGRRTVILIVNIDDPSKIPYFAEPWFLSFNADVQFDIVMSPDDQGWARLDALEKKWS